MIQQLSAFLNRPLSFDGPLLTSQLEGKAGGGGGGAPAQPDDGCVVHIFVALLRSKFASKFPHTAFVFSGGKTRRQRRSYEEAQQNGPCFSRSQTGNK